MNSIEYWLKEIENSQFNEFQDASWERSSQYALSQIVYLVQIVKLLVFENEQLKADIGNLEEVCKDLRSDVKYLERNL